MRKISGVLVTLLILSVNIVSPFQLMPVYADIPNDSVSLSIGEKYYVLGDILNIKVEGEPNTTFTLRILYDGETLVYSRDYQLNGSGVRLINLPIQNGFEYGYYTVRAITTVSVSESLFTFVKTDGFSSVVFPIQKTHNGVDYELLSDGTLKASRGEANLKIELPLLNVDWDSINVYKNSMMFLARFRKGLVSIDLSLVLIHSGLKMIINGTNENPQTFAFKLNPQKYSNILNGFKSLKGNLVFDYSDLIKTKQSFNYDKYNGELNVFIPKSFSVDPSIFASGFECATYAACGWDGTKTDAGQVLEISQTFAFEGTNSSHVFSKGAANFDAYARENIAGAPAEMWFRFMIYFTNITISTNFRRYSIWTQFDDFQIHLNARRDGAGDPRWYLTPRAPFAENEGSVILLGQWYCVEGYYQVDAVNGTRAYWVDTNLQHFEDGKNNALKTITQIFAGTDDGLGFITDAGDGIEYYMDFLELDSADRLGCDLPRVIGELPSVEDLVNNDTTTSTTYEDVDGLSVNITTAEQADILIMASIQAEANISAVASYRLVFDGVNFQGLRRQVGTLAGNMVLVDLVEDKAAGNYELKLQHNISAGLLSTINTTIYAVQLHNGNGRVPANSSFTESDTIAAAVPAAISGLSTEITLERTSHVWMALTWAGEFTLSPREGNFTIEINADNMESRHRHWTSANEWGGLSLVTRTDEKLPNDTYTVRGIWQGDNTGTLTGMNFSLVVFAGEANGTVAEFDILKVVNPSDTTTAVVFEDMDDLTLNFTTPDTSHVMGFLTLDSEVSNINTDIFNTISINGTDQEEMKRGHSSAAQSLGSEGQVVRTNSTLSAGVGNMTGRWHTDAGNTATGTAIILVAIVLFTEDTGLVELTIIFYTGISEVFVGGASKDNLSVTFVTLGDTVNITSTVSSNFVFYRYEFVEFANHTHLTQHNQTMNQDLTAEAFTLAIGAAGVTSVAGVSMLLFAILVGFAVIVLIGVIASRKR